MSEQMLSPFQIRNLEPSSQASTGQDNLVRISAPGYDSTISKNPDAKLRYKDEENDTIIVSAHDTPGALLTPSTNAPHSLDLLVS